MKNVNFIKPIFIALIVVLSANVNIAQNNLGIINFQNVPQSNLANPAFVPDFEMHFGVPGLSSVYAGFGNSGAKYNQIMTRRDDDSLILNSQSFLDHIKDKNNINFKVNQQWLNFGMKWRDWYFNASISEVEDFNLHYSNDLISLALRGNGASVGQTIDISPVNLKHLHYREYAFGAAYKLDETWTFGAKLKFLFGKSGIRTKTFDAQLTTAENTYYLTADYNVLVNTSMPDGMRYDSIDFDFGSYMFSAKNFGMAMDLGATYKYDDTYSFSASLVDFGVIRFNDNVINYAGDERTFTFEGIDINEFIGISDTAIEEEMQHIGDSLMDKFNLTKKYNNFNTLLTAKFYLAGNYKLSATQDISVLFRGEIFNNTLRPSFTASYKHKINEYITAMGSYTVINRNIGNIGAGVMVNYKPVQFYLITDNIFGLFMPDATKYANIHLGFNIYFPESSQRSLINL